MPTPTLTTPSGQPVKGWVEAASGGRFRPRFRIGGREARKHSGPYFDYRWEAEVWLIEELPGQVGIRPAGEASPAAPQGPQETTAGPTLGQYAHEYLERRRGLISATTRGNYVRDVERFGQLGELPMAGIAKPDVERWVTGLVAAGVGAPSVNNAVRMLRMLYRDAQAPDPSYGIRKLAVIPSDPQLVQRPDEVALLLACTDEESGRRLLAGAARTNLRDLAEHVGLTMSTCSMVLNGRPGPSERTRARVQAAAAELGYVHHQLSGPDAELRVMVLLGLDAGLRWEETAGLPASAVARDYLSIRQALLRNSRKLGPPKGRRARTVPLTPRLAEALAPLVAAARLRGGPDELLFRASTGQPLSYWGSSDRLERAAERAKLDPRPSWHDLRHTYASRLAEAGVPIHEIQALLGHADAKTTQRYVHAGTDGRRRDLVLAALGAAA